MAGTASRVPETSPLISAWRMRFMCWGRATPVARSFSRAQETARLESRAPSGVQTSSDLHQGELAALDLLIAEFAGEDVALLVEVARPRGAGVVDLLPGGDRLDAVDGVVDRLAAALADLADIVLDGDTGRVLGLRHRHQHHAGVVVDLAGVRIGRGEARSPFQLLVG